MKQGFTLVELLIVVLIVGVLSAIALPQYTTAIERARAAEALTLLGAVRDSVERYRFQHDVWPSNWSDLDISVPLVPGSSSKRGSKNFELQIGTTGNDVTGTKWAVIANRSLSDGQGGYTLRIGLEDDAANETITSTRTCGKKLEEGQWGAISAPEGSKAETFCNAITGGHNGDF